MAPRYPHPHRKEVPTAAITAGILLAVAIVLAAFLFWPRGATTTGTAMRDDFPRVQRPAVTPAPVPTTFPQ